MGVANNEEGAGADVDEKFETLVEANDTLLERVVTTLPSFIVAEMHTLGGGWHIFKDML